MCAQTVTEENSSSSLINPKMPWRVAEVEVLPDFCLKVRFLDGMEGIVDMDRLVHSDDAGVFAVLSDPARFAQVSIEYGAVTWPGELDLAPDAMHQAIKAFGQWVLS